MKSLSLFKIKLNKISMKNLSLFEIWLTILIVISFFLFSLYVLKIDSPEKYVPIFTAIAAVYAPFGAWKIAEKWKEQKQFDIRKDLIMEIIEEINEVSVKVHAVRRMLYRVTHGIEKRERFILSPRYILNLSETVDFLHNITRIKGKVETYCHIVDNNELLSDFENLRKFSSTGFIHSQLFEYRYKSCVDAVFNINGTSIENLSGDTAYNLNNTKYSKNVLFKQKIKAITEMMHKNVTTSNDTMPSHKVLNKFNNECVKFKKKILKHGNLKQ